MLTRPWLSQWNQDAAFCLAGEPGDCVLQLRKPPRMGPAFAVRGATARFIGEAPIARQATHCRSPRHDRCWKTGEQTFAQTTAMKTRILILTLLVVWNGLAADPPEDLKPRRDRSTNTVPRSYDTNRVNPVLTNRFGTNATAFSNRFRTNSIGRIPTRHPDFPPDNFPPDTFPPDRFQPDRFPSDRFPSDRFPPDRIQPITPPVIPPELEPPVRPSIPPSTARKPLPPRGLSIRSGITPSARPVATPISVVDSTPAK